MTAGEAASSRRFPPASTKGGAPPRRRRGAGGPRDQLIRSANDVRFGLAAGVWTRALSRMLRVAEAIRAGTVWVNPYRSASYLSPFGGYKDSGLGRENGQDMIREDLQVKSGWINIGAKTANPFVM